MTAVLALTLGAGRRNPRGRTVSAPSLADVPAIIEKHQPGQEAWWSTHTWQDGHRSGDRWVGSAGVMVDLDYIDQGEHVAPPEHVAAAIESDARDGLIPGSIFHRTPRGARIVFLFSEQCTDPDTFRAAAQGAAKLVKQALSRHPGYTIDERVLTDLARLMFAPNTTVAGRKRRADVIQMQEEPFAPEALARLADPEEEPETPRKTPQAALQAAPQTDFAEAVRRWNLDHRQEWPRNSSRCPACGGSASFGVLPGDDSRWYCFSDKHTEPGVKGEQGYHGDALDLEAYRRGCKPADVLRQDGYLAARAQQPQRHLRAVPDNVVSIEPDNFEFGRNFPTLCRLLEHDRRIVPEPLEWNEMLMSPTIGGEPIENTFTSYLREKIELTVTDSKGKGLRFSAADVEAAVEYIASKHKYHPVREYLTGLEWDGIERLNHVCEDILGAERSELHQAMVRKWFISAVARALKPGEKVDTVLILQGTQGAGKSTFFAELAGRAWFSDSPIDISSRDAPMVLRRVWILEWSELESMQRARDSAAVKQFISTQIDTYRPPYGRRTIDAPRHCVIVGTTNEEGILTDPTGNRRYWIIPVADEIDIDALRAQREQLWAEAVAAYRAGETWWLDRTQERELAQAQKQFERRDAWEELILPWVEKQADPPQLSEVLEFALDKRPGQWTRQDELRVGAILRRAGYSRQRVRRAGERVYAWVHEGEA